MDHQGYMSALLCMRDRLPPDWRGRFLPAVFNGAPNPTLAFGFSLYLGVFAIDRFYIGDWGKGLAKLLTLAGFGVWWIIDWFLISGRAQQKNLVRADAILAEFQAEAAP